MPTPKKSTEHKRLTGSYRPDRDLDLVMDVEAVGGIEPPDTLSEVELQIWRDAVAAAPVGLLKRIDQAVLYTWVTSYYMMIESASDIVANGSKILLPNGYYQQNPSVMTWAKASSTLAKASSQLGFDPQSRMRIKHIEPRKEKGPEDDPWFKFIIKNHFKDSPERVGMFERLGLTDTFPECKHKRYPKDDERAVKS